MLEIGLLEKYINRKCATVITEHCCAKKELKSNLSKISNTFMIVVSCILEGIKEIFLLFKKLFRIDFFRIHELVLSFNSLIDNLE